MNLQTNATTITYPTALRLNGAFRVPQPKKMEKELNHHALQAPHQQMTLNPSFIYLSYFNNLIMQSRAAQQ
jgi:hypothetical protein